MNSWIISGIILAAGFFICLVLILRAKWKAGRKNINDYQEGRDKLTFREKKEEKEDEVEERDFGGLLGNIIGGFIMLLVGVSLLPIVAQEIGTACSEQLNVSSAANTMLCSSSGEPGGILGMVTILFALGIVIAVISIVASGFRRSGLI